LRTTRGSQQPFPIPPAKLRFKVAENANASTFVRVGRQTAENVEAAPAHGKCVLESGHAVLDFGCGCGRTLLWLSRRFPGVQWHGSDVDRDAIEWCRANISNASFAVNGPLPPLPFNDGSFDVIYVVSVFTHLNDEYQKAWIPELCRGIRNGGTLVLTIYGRHIWQALDESKAVESNEQVFRTSTKAERNRPGLVPHLVSKPVPDSVGGLGVLQ
jgi:cyclopropane fatty-acyl-phospholipid synthase-like methyltransferase